MVHNFQTADTSLNLELSPPNHPQSNSLFERVVCSVKEMLKKNPGLFSLDEILFSYRAAPLACGKSPLELLFSQPLTTRLDRMLPNQTRERKNKLKNGMEVW
ncbi:unnamed protein product [Lepeophtheirus salmonis]|uniref:(salmon louse) hypothetical protein n=1 Tax=Lepeophtheirus salmonis TaxID=72036 RepID=A0A7R8H925_LEPSM|nr:unnamed protein product [Lepeophtheirus salmonis]CAF2951832.1 unnamed protein product [Lepeophtheirus salmonis]